MKIFASSKSVLDLSRYFSGSNEPSEESEQEEIFVKSSKAKAKAIMLDCSDRLKASNPLLKRKTYILNEGYRCHEVNVEFDQPDLKTLSCFKVPPSRNNGSKTENGVSEHQQWIADMLAPIVEKFGECRIDDTYSVGLEIHVNLKRNSDMDNRVKSIQDALEETGILHNDCYVDFLHVERSGFPFLGYFMLRISKPFMNPIRF